jgi:beta-glucosidase
MADGIYRFPNDFLWGTATAAHHVEGELTNSWSVWEDAGGHVFENQKHGRACEWRFGRWREDFQRMSDLNTNTHRLSVEWSRIQPSPDTWDDEALAQYSEWIDDLRSRGIEPMVSLHHFTNPVWVEEQGGWLNPKTVDLFARFTERVLKVLGDRVTLWCTFNEPMVYAVQAYLVGFFNPGVKNPWKMYLCAELLLRAHAAAYQVIKSVNPEAKVGVAKHILAFEAAPPRFLNQILVGLPTQVFNNAFVEALVSGELSFPGRRKTIIPDLAGTSDYLGVNFYQRYRVGFTPDPRFMFVNQFPDPDSPEPPPLWGEIYPQGIFNVINQMYKMTHLPLYITETGTPDIGDEIRRWYIAQVVHGIWKAINFNIPVKGLYFWSLLDSFEWTAGYDPRFSFGLYKVNFETQERTKRPSGDFYGEICAAKGLSGDMVRRYVPQLEETLFPGSPGLSKVTLRQGLKQS